MDVVLEPPAPRKRGRPAKNKPVTITPVADCETESNVRQSRGCCIALQTMLTCFENDLMLYVPALCDAIWTPFNENLPLSPAIDNQSRVNWLALLEISLPVLHESLLSEIFPNVRILEAHLYCSKKAVRHMAARVFSQMCLLPHRNGSKFIIFALESILPNLSSTDDDVFKKRGSIECFSEVVTKLKLRILPYASILIVPMLSTSSDCDEQVRLMGSQVFASLVEILPLDGSSTDPVDMPDSLIEIRNKNRNFLTQLLDGSKARNFQLDISVEATLRDYQQAGVNWLAFLRDYGVHGILCDDMGLGKTLQTICILASTHKKCKDSGGKSYSLVVCPPTLTGHWVHEISKFISADILKPLEYCGLLNERIKLRPTFGDHDIIVASYDIVRNDIEFLKSCKWLYIVLDEGHVVKNTKTKSYKAIKQLRGNHRLILTGTPIQNNVLELWALFDFLMPGYFGSEKSFSTKFAKPILQSRDAKASSSDQEAGILAMQVSPFILLKISMVL